MSDFFKKKPSEILFDQINEKFGDVYPQYVDELKDIIEDRDNG